MPALTLDRVIFMLACFFMAQGWRDLRDRVKSLETKHEDERSLVASLEVVKNDIKHMMKSMAELKSDFKACAGCKVTE